MGNSAKYPSLNIGCCDNPVDLSEDIFINFDMDGWTGFRRFVQGDAQFLPFSDRSFDTVVMGDIVEHLEHPLETVIEAARVTNRVLVMTIFEEWRLPGYGQHIKLGRQIADAETRKHGYEDYPDMHRKTSKGRLRECEFDISHICHINQFTEADILY